MNKIALRVGAASFTIGVLIACGSNDAGTKDGSTGDGDNPFADGGGPTDGSGDTNLYIDGIGPCTPGTTQCTNCKDDDGDGLIDWMDPECTGPLDNDEATFSTGIPGDNVDPCKQDCFFDGNSGSGDDKCEWNLKCDPKSPGAPKCPYDPNFKNCPMQMMACLNFCKPLTPNGCDCFGCCALPDFDGGTAYVKLVSTCTAQDVNDPMKCPPCVPVTDCFNPCDKCELCLGKTTLPPECDGGAMGCAMGQQACNQNMPCPQGQYCLTGCCVPNVN
jgi:hypothetical protein